MKIESVLVTGANRGIGLEFVRQFSRLEDPPCFIFATYRNEHALEDLTKIQHDSGKCRVILIKLDVTVNEEIEVAKKIVEETVGDRGLTLLINNAGLVQPQGFPLIRPENLELHFKTNTVGPIMILQAFFPLLEKAASASKIKEMSASRSAVLNLTSFIGSIQRTGVDLIGGGSAIAYKISKASLNMSMRVIAANVKEKGVLVVNMCPGWVNTSMGSRGKAEIEPEESIANMLKTLPTLNESHHGSYIDRLGKPYPF